VGADLPVVLVEFLSRRPILPLGFLLGFSNFRVMAIYGALDLCVVLPHFSVVAVDCLPLPGFFLPDYVP
jgi:hypothetical protein